MMAFFGVDDWSPPRDTSCGVSPPQHLAAVKSAATKRRFPYGFREAFGTISNFSLFVCGPCSKPSPKLLVIDDFETSRGNIPTTLPLGLAAAASVYTALLSRPLINLYAACS